MLTEDDIAVNRAIGPDRADPPSHPASDGHSRRPYGGGLPSGGPPGGFRLEAHQEEEAPGDPPGGGGGAGSPGANLAPLRSKQGKR